MLFYRYFLFYLLLFSVGLNAQSPCLTRLTDRDDVQQRKEVLDQKIRNWIATQSELKERSIVTIPIVIHVVWHEDVENISDAQIASQLEVLNAAFRAQPTNLNVVPSIFQNLVVDTEIEFCLAQRTPTNQPTNGIERTYIDEPAITNDRMALFAASPLWNPREYLNIYVVRLGGGVDGDATFPAEATEENDAIRINYRSFGTVGTALENPARSGGKSLVHEVGHYLGLQHIWGQEEGCTFDDFGGNNDTPLQSRSYLGQCPSGLQTSCATPDMYMNFMDYTDDACLAMFTPDQKAWMLGVLNTSRSGLLQSRACDSTVHTTIAMDSMAVVFWYDQVDKKINLKFAKSQEVIQLKLFDVVGRVVATQSYEQQQVIQWNIPNQSRGIYYLQVDSDNKKGSYALFF